MTLPSGEPTRGVALAARALVEGAAEGEALVLEEPLSFWGGFDPETGMLIDRRHAQAGTVARGKVLVMPWGRGSSSSSSVLAEAIRAGTGPAGIILAEPDGILALGALVAGLLYGGSCPVVVVAGPEYRSIRPGVRLRIEAAGGVAVVRTG